MKPKHLMPLILLVVVTVFVVAPALAGNMGNGPKYAKHVASLEDDSGNRFGQAIFNTNPEDDGTYELEVEVEECMGLTDSTLNVSLDGDEIGEIYIDEYGNGKATFYVDFISTGNAVNVEGDISLQSGEWRFWEKKKGPK